MSADGLPGVDVAVIDFDLSNLKSICRGLADAGASSVRVARRPGDLGSPTHIVLPGVGSFAAASANLETNGWFSFFEALGESGPPAVLGVCLGLQLMGDSSQEGEGRRGLGRIPGPTMRLAVGAHERLPHVGWNEVHFRREHPMGRGIPDGSDFYFVHSYALTPDDPAAIVASTGFAGGFSSAIATGNTWAVQFHPEKSSRVGLRLLRNFLCWDGE